MNKKLLGFSLVPSTLVSSASGVVSAEDYEKEPFFSMPKSLGIPESVINAINEAVSINNDICKKIEENRNLYVKKDGSFMDKIKDAHRDLRTARRLACEVISKNYFPNECKKILPWKELKESDFGDLFNFEVENFLNNYGDYEDDLLTDAELLGKIRNLIEDYSFYLERVKSLRKDLKDKDHISDGYKHCGYNPGRKELAMYFQVLNILKNKIEEVQREHQDTGETCGRICNGICNIF